MQPKRVVVVGGTGNISGALTDALAAAGHDVTVFVRGTRERHLPEGVRVLTGDRHDRAEFEKTMQREAFDAAFDMICFNAEDAESDLRAFDGVGHFVHTSSIATFGGPLPTSPADESTPLRPNLAYGYHKVRADEVFLDAHRERGFPVTIFKPAHTWGPGFALIRQVGQDPRWTDRLRAGKPLLMAGSGRKLWTMCHSEDAAQAYVGVLGQPWAFGETYIVSGDRLTWLEYHEQVAEALGAPLRLVFAPVDAVVACWPEITQLLRAFNRWDQWYDTSKLRNALPSFQPRLTLRERAAENVAWMDSLTEPPSVPDREDEVLRVLEPLLSDEPIEAHELYAAG